MIAKKPVAVSAPEKAATVEGAHFVGMPTAFGSPRIAAAWPPYPQRCMLSPKTNRVSG